MSTRGLFRRCRQQMPLGAVRNGAAAGGSRGRLCSPPGRGRPPGARGGSEQDTCGVTARPPGAPGGSARDTRGVTAEGARGVHPPHQRRPSDRQSRGCPPVASAVTGAGQGAHSPPVVVVPTAPEPDGAGGAINPELSPPPPAPLSHGEPGFGGGDSCQAEGTNAGCPA